MRGRGRTGGSSALVASAAVVAVVITTVALAFLTPGPVPAATSTFIPLYAAGITVQAEGTRVVLPPDATGAAPETPARLAWLNAGAIPGDDTQFADLSARALLDLDALTIPVETGTTPQRYAVVAAWQDGWHYVWPRDAAFAAVAYARAGHIDRAWGILAYLQDVQSAEGTFQARYLPSLPAATPDDRAPQSDALGWALWGAQQVIEAAPPAQRAKMRSALDPLIARATEAALRLTDHGRRLPPPSSDYWELREVRLTLGIAAPMLMALQASGHLGRSDAAAAAETYEEVVVATFGAQGYPRQRGWIGSLGASAPDTSVSFLRRPFVDADLPGTRAIAVAAQAAMARPAGGLAPGGSWRRDGISWTPTTSVYAVVAACGGDSAAATHWLSWLAAHRTAAGSLPEKVLSDGSPAAVAPLAWTSANVLIALDCLASGTMSVP